MAEFLGSRVRPPAPEVNFMPSKLSSQYTQKLEELPRAYETATARSKAATADTARSV
jgi:hypothetical protein